MKTKIYDVAYEIQGDTIDIEQDVGCGEVNAVYLHAIHVRLFASELGLMQGDADAWRRVATLERRLRLLRDRIEELDDMIWAVPICPPGSPPTGDCIYSQATLQIAEEFCADLGAQGSGADAVTPSNATKSQVTPTKRQRDLLEGAQ